MEEELNEGISEEFDKELNRIVGDLFEELKKQAMSSVRRNFSEGH